MASLRACLKCQKWKIICSCQTYNLFGWRNGYGSWYMHCGDEPSDILDIENIEAQPETDLDVASPSCDKSNEHYKFICVDEFTLNHLPEELRHLSVYIWLRHCTPFVVRLLSDTITATGRACIISQDIGTEVVCNNQQCPFLSTLGQNHKLHGGIGIITNKHVVKNDADAAMTIIEFFYNNEYRHWVVRETGMTVHSTNKRMDYTVFRCYVHSKDLIKNIEIFDMLRDYSWLQIPQCIRELAKSYAIIISHPHGASKRISIGKVIDREVRQKTADIIENAQLLRRIYDICEENDALLRFSTYISLCPDINIPISVTFYTTSTCRGSSGAPVFMGNIVMENGKEINQAHTHRGVDKFRGYNNCFT